MTRYWALVLACGLAFTLAAGGCAMSNREGDDDEKEHAVKMDELPAAVKATLTKEAGAGKIEEIDKHTHNGKTVYEADVLADGKKWEISVREDGQLLKKELDEEKDDEDDKDDDDKDD